MARRIRWSVPLIAMAMTLLLAGTALAAVTYGAETKVSPKYSWNYGNSLAASSCSSTDYLNTVYATDFVKGAWASDTGPYQGVYVRRANTAVSPLAWTKPKRVNPATQHAERPTLAAAGSNVYVGWVSQVSYDNYDGSQKRVFYVKRSTDCGATWGAATALSPGTGRVDYPILSASGSNVYAIWVDAATGNVRFRRSIDGGANWGTGSTVGTTTSIDSGNTAEGYYGYPSVGSSGSNVLIGWYTNSAGRMVARTSNDGGASFGSEIELAATSPNDTIHYLVAGGQDDGAANRVAVAYTTGNYTTGKVAVRVYNGTSLAAQQTILDYGDTVGGKVILGSYGPAPQPFGSSGLLVAFPGCRQVGGLTNPCNYNKSTMKSDLLVRETQDGSTWGAVQVVTASTTTHPINDSVSIVSTGSGAGQTRYLLYNGWKANYGNYATFMKIGTGAGP